MKYDAIIIGASLGGLTAGAFLARAGRKILVLEKTAAMGGRCRSAEIMGRRFDIGAHYFGRGMLDAFSALGKAGELAPLKFRTLLLADGKSVTSPPGPRTIGELMRLGMGVGDMARFGFRMSRQVLFGTYSKKISNCLELVNALTEDPALREVLNSGANFTGNDPENMPSALFNIFFGNVYGYNRPFYPRGGSGRIPELLAEVIREEGGAIVYNSPIERIIVDKGRARGVALDGRDLESDCVISGAGIVQTVELAGRECFPREYLDTVGYYKEGLAVASIFAVFKRTAGLTKGVHSYTSLPKNTVAMFRVLKEGRFPDRPAFTFSCPDALSDPGTEHLAGTIRFLVPKGEFKQQALEDAARRVVGLMDELVPRFAESVVDMRLMGPREYEEQFGFRSTVSPVIDSVNYQKMGQATTVDGLYAVGATVLPAGGCTVSAVESGRLCAGMILKAKV